MLISRQGLGRPIVSQQLPPNRKRRQGCLRRNQCTNESKINGARGSWFKRNPSLRRMYPPSLSKHCGKPLYIPKELCPHSILKLGIHGASLAAKEENKAPMSSGTVCVLCVSLLFFYWLFKPTTTYNYHCVLLQIIRDRMTTSKLAGDNYVEWSNGIRSRTKWILMRKCFWY